MNGSRRIRLAMLTLLACSAVGIGKAENAEPRSHGRREVRNSHVTDYTVTGTVARHMWKDKEGITRVAYSVVMAGGDVVWFSTGNRAEDNQPTLNQLDKFTDKNITVAGKGYTSEEKGKTTAYLVSVSYIVVNDPNAPPPAGK
jgi:hypothetical protein